MSSSGTSELPMGSTSAASPVREQQAVACVALFGHDLCVARCRRSAHSRHVRNFESATVRTRCKLFTAPNHRTEGPAQAIGLIGSSGPAGATGGATLKSNRAEQLLRSKAGKPLSQPYLKAFLLVSYLLSLSAMRAIACQRRERSSSVVHQ
jgi:hypothetical protein